MLLFVFCYEHAIEIHVVMEFIKVFIKVQAFIRFSASKRWMELHCPRRSIGEGYLGVMESDNLGHWVEM
jgi:hypothetical protein